MKNKKEAAQNHSETIKELLNLPRTPFIEMKWTKWGKSNYFNLYRIHDVSKFYENKLSISQESLEHNNFSSEETISGNKASAYEMLRNSIDSYLSAGWEITVVDKAQWIKYFGVCPYKKNKQPRI